MRQHQQNQFLYLGEPATNLSIRIPGNFWIRIKGATSSLSAYTILHEAMNNDKIIEFFDIGYAEQGLSRCERRLAYQAERKAKQEPYSSDTELRNRSDLNPIINFKSIHFGTSVRDACRTFSQKLENVSPDHQEIAAQLLLGVMVTAFETNRYLSIGHDDVKISPRIMLGSAIKALCYLLGGEQGPTGSEARVSKTLRGGLDSKIAHSCIRLGRAITTLSPSLLVEDCKKYREQGGIEQLYKSRSPEDLAAVVKLFWQDLLPLLATKVRASRHGPRKEDILAALQPPEYTL